MDQPVTLTPTALASIVADMEYFMRNSGSEKIHVQIDTAAPDPDSTGAFPVPPGEDLYVSAAAGESVFVWAPRAPSHVVYELN